MNRSLTDRKRPVGQSSKLAWMLAGTVVIIGVIILISWWPRHVDTDVLKVVERVIPRISHTVVNSPAYPLTEVVSNVLMYVPLGAIVAAIASALSARVLGSGVTGAIASAVGVGLVVSVIAEGGQALWLSLRQPSVLDILANGVGALLGAVVLVTALRARSRRLR